CCSPYRPRWRAWVGWCRRSRAVSTAAGAGCCSSPCAGHVRPRRCWSGSPAESAIQALAVRTPECPPAGLAQMLAELQAGAVTWTFRAGVHLVVALEHEGLLPFQEVEAVVARLVHQFAQFARRQCAHPAFRMHPGPVQHLVLDDVPDPGKHVLV